MSSTMSGATKTKGEATGHGSRRCDAPRRRHERPMASARRHLHTRADRITSAGQERPNGVDAEAGMTTAEYAVGTIAAVGFAGVLIKLVSTDTVRNLLTSVIKSAFAPFVA